MANKITTRVIKADGGVRREALISKAEHATAEQEKQTGYRDIIEPIYPVAAVRQVVDHSTILPQCIRAYESNIPGFGIEVRYKDDDTAGEETPEMKAEWDRLDEIIKYFNFDMPFSELLEKVIKDREKTAAGYLEIIRNAAGEVVGGEYVDPEYIKVSKLGDRIPVEVVRYGQHRTIHKRFRYFVQEINGTSSKKVYFKQFGDPRIMNYKTGKYDDNTLPEEQANEILQLKIGEGAYGVPRWIGQSIHVEGSRLAENLNFNYFINGRHVPMAIMVKNGTLSDASFADLQAYMNSVKGADNAHQFLLFEVEGSEDEEEIDVNSKANRADIEIKDLAAMLQNDALFLEYQDKSRQKTQSAFNLPDLYVGYTRDFNRATAEAAIEITEKQVFIPERKKLQWIINNVLLAEYEFKHVEAHIKGPDLSNPDDMYKILSVVIKAGGVTPNDAREILSWILKKTLDNFPEEWGDIPLEMQRLLSQPQQPQTPEGLIKAAETVISKAQEEPSSQGIELVGIMKAMVNVMKDTRDVLEEIGGSDHE